MDGPRRLAVFLMVLVLVLSWQISGEGLKTVELGDDLQVEQLAPGIWRHVSWHDVEERAGRCHVADEGTTRNTAGHDETP